MVVQFKQSEKGYFIGRPELYIRWCAWLSDHWWVIVKNIQYLGMKNHGCGDLPHVSVHVHLYASVHVTVPLLDHLSLPPYLLRQPSKYPGTFYLDRISSLSEQHLPASPKSSLLCETMTIWHRSDWWNLPPFLCLQQWTITSCQVASWHAVWCSHQPP